MKTNSTLAGVRPRFHERYRHLPIFGRWLDDFVPWAFDRGYTRVTVRRQLDAVRHLSDWFRRRRRLSAFTLDDLAAAHRCFSKRQWNCAAGLRGFGAFLQARDLVKPRRAQPFTRSQQEMARFREYLLKQRGAADRTCDTYEAYVLDSLKFLGFDGHKTALKTLRLATVHRYLRRLSGRYHRKTLQQVLGAIRGFLRFQFVRGVIPEPLHTQIDTVRTYQEEYLPYPVQWSELQQLIQRIDRSTPVGLRDYAVVLLGATYGLRASDVAHLTLDDLDWRQRTLQIVQRKTRQPLALPLTDEVGAALADYLRRGRPACSCRQVFLRWLAPIAPLTLGGASDMLRAASQRAGVPLKAAGFRCLRHALAVRLLRQGASLKEIGDVFGHRRPLSAAAYLRLHVEDLRSAALPVPLPSKRDVPIQPTSLEGLPIRRGRSRTAPPGWRWKSVFGKAMTNYLALQRALGRGYQTEAATLRALDCFLVGHYPRAKRFTPALFAAWAKGLRPLCPTTARMRMLQVRKFCCHLARSRSGMFIPDLRTFPKALPHQAPYLFSETEVARVLAASAALRSTRRNPLHPQTMRVAFLLTYCCGLRKGEVRRLRLADLDLKAGVLRIHQTKFYKSRLVPLSPSVAERVRRYLSARTQKNLPMEPGAPLLWNGRPHRPGQARAVGDSCLQDTWKELCRGAQVFDHRGQRPRIHDLRHSFAVEALRRAYRAGQNPQTFLPCLARYMGHGHMLYTHYYLKFTEPLRCAASERFHQSFAATILPPAAPKQGGAS